MEAKNEKDYISTYESMGYKASYRFTDERLIDNQTGNRFTPLDIFIVAEHRFEGCSNPEDLSILYVIETENGSKGTLLAGYGPTSDLELSEFFKEVPISQYSNKKNINFSDQ